MEASNWYRRFVWHSATAPLDTELRFLASHVRGAEQDAGGVKVVVSADNVSVYSAPAMVVRSLPLSSCCLEHGRAERNGYTLVQNLKEWK
jgi:hypothetical protein